MDKLNVLSTPEKAIAGGGVLMFIASFFDWWHASSPNVTIDGTTIQFGGGSIGRSGWGAPGDVWSILAILVAIALVGLLVAIKFGNVQMPALPQGVTWGRIWGGGAALVVVLMLLKAWRILAAPYGGFGIGFYIAVIATVAIAYGGYMLYAEERSASGAGIRR